LVNLVWTENPTIPWKECMRIFQKMAVESPEFWQTRS
jgi:hypothetical protein